MRIKTCVLCLSVGLMVALIGVASAQESYQDLTFPPLTFTPPDIERHTLDNGMTLFFVEDHELPVISMYALVKTGGIYVPADKIGLASMTAEVMRTGGTASRSPDDVNETLEYLAASVEVDISDESGSVELWTLKDNLETSLDVFADILRNPAFEPSKVDLAKRQMLEIIRRRNDSPDSIRSREFMRIVYGRMHPLARIPQLDTIMNITRKDLVAFHQQYFQPNNVMLAVTGDFEPEVMLQQLQAVFQDWQPADIAFPEVETADYGLSRSVYVIDKDIEQTSLALGHLGIKADNPDYPAVRVLDLILGAGGFSSRLFQEVRNERGLAYSVGSYLGAGVRDYGVFLIFCGTRNDAVHEAIEVILEEVNRLTVAEVSDEELQAAKDQYLNSYVFKFATVDDIIRRKMFYEYVGYPPDFLETFRERVMQVTAADVLRVAKAYLHPEAMSILAVGDQEAIADALVAFGTVQEFELEPVE
ncbi:insulinase family protein [candidate division KSB3 bacterium]|uniref:Insulinase family protein n=1 Tax=candidate division KSB3 bacterium TaxID=2044937 RepID=A0A9D5JWC9_9BACT|nr:insulinase family protein [candidate division KSB3 bacterium]MBD3325502.1 insulinase family protein [candidate division KSB3 bacterium]